MPNYSDCVIYTITTPNGLYVGSTCNFTNRKYNHKNAIYNENNKGYPCKLYQNIRENDGEWIMKPYSQFPCESKMQMNIEEERIRRELNADLNSYFCCGFDNEKLKKTQKKYYQKNKNQKIEYQIEYNKANKEKINEYQKKYNAENKEKIKEKREAHKEKKKEYDKQRREAKKNM